VKVGQAYGGSGKRPVFHDDLVSRSGDRVKAEVIYVFSGEDRPVGRRWNRYGGAAGATVPMVDGDIADLEFLVGIGIVNQSRETARKVGCVYDRVATLAIVSKIDFNFATRSAVEIPLSRQRFKGKGINITCVVT